MKNRAATKRAVEQRHVEVLEREHDEHVERVRRLRGVVVAELERMIRGLDRE